MRRLPVIALSLALLSPVLGGCGEEVKRYVANAGSSTPTMATLNVQTFISDSGYTRYHLSTPAWYVYDDTSQPFWRFPDGLELEQFDDNMRTVSTVVCDSAIYFSRQRLWQLDGNVVMVSTDGDSFLTEQLFWEQETRRIRSDSFIHIVRSDRILEGYGFESDQAMADYLIHHPTAILPAERPGPRTARDSVQKDGRGDSVRPGSAPRPSERKPRRAEPTAQEPTLTKEEPSTQTRRFNHRPSAGSIRARDTEKKATR